MIGLVLVRLREEWGLYGNVNKEVWDVCVEQESLLKSLSKYGEEYG